ncbi:type II toxin-antitoxin system RelE/ParE family toxin [Flavobacterium marginilacus]|uniref:type II toxin-antitoxin system RelE/ParE family toxin n=1 Tax=Flavobacterium marginilacus TaxID=3003256 RepID=UPI00248E5158|nr:type II toxin-antitoxin system RelE/ParE family toxin [Flavobacterium marginilacus]
MIVFDFELNYFEEVERDIDNAKLWYYEQNPDTDLEERFAKAIKEIILKIQKNPFIYSPIFKNISIAHPKIFPYGIHFYIEEDLKQITIVAILHNKQDKRKLNERL